MRQTSETLLRESLGSVGFSTSYSVGTSMQPATAIAYALDEQPGHDAAPDVGPDRLTKREQQVAELVATGLSNQDIASKLVLSRANRGRPYRAYAHQARLQVADPARGLGLRPAQVMSRSPHKAAASSTP